MAAGIAFILLAAGFVAASSVMQRRSRRNDEAE